MIYLIYKFIFGFHMIHILICQIYVGNIYFEILQKWPFIFFFQSLEFEICKYIANIEMYS